VPEPLPPRPQPTSARRRRSRRRAPRATASVERLELHGLPLLISRNFCWSR
jgi:hypothetical protein